MSGTYATKAISDFAIKNVDQGIVTAVVSTMNVVDREGDVILSGAVAAGSVVKISGYDHDVILKELPPVGIGELSIRGDQVVMEGKYFLNTARGRDAFETVKGLGPHSEWSVGFPKDVKTSPLTDQWRAKGARRLIAGLTILETSPVFMGANALTGTLAAKAHDADEAVLQEVSRIFRRNAAAMRARHDDTRLSAALIGASATLQELELHHIARRCRDFDLTRPDSAPLAAKFRPLFDFARCALGLDRSELPEPRMVRKGTLEGLGRFVHDGTRTRIFLEADHPDDEIARTLLHECIHAHQLKCGDPLDDNDAERRAQALYARWMQENGE